MKNQKREGEENNNKNEIIIEIQWIGIRIEIKTL